MDRGASTDTYAYDANGNMTCRVEDGDTYNQVYNPENRMAVAQLLRTGVDCPAANTLVLESNTLAAWQFVYDGDGTRVKQVYIEYAENGAPTSTVTTYLFAGGSYEVQVDGAETITKLYYAIAGQVVGMSVRDTGTPETVTLSYFLTDHLGSVVVVTDASGALVSEQRYLPFGEVREDVGIAVTQTDFGYTFQRNIDGQGSQYTLGLMDYRARFYSSVLGRFSQPDTIVPGAGSTQAWNRYAYVKNNPLTLIDPSGHDDIPVGLWGELTADIGYLKNNYPSKSPIGAMVGAGIGGLVGGLAGLLTGNPVIAVGLAVAGAVVGAYIGYKIDEDITAVNTDLSNVYDLMDKASNDDDIKNDGIVCGCGEYYFETTYTDVYQNDQYLSTYQTTTLYVYTDEKWDSYTFRTTEGVSSVMDVFQEHGVKPTEKYKSIRKDLPESY